MDIDTPRQHQQQAGAHRQRDRQEYADQRIRRQAGAVAQIVEQHAEQQTVGEQAAIGGGIGLAQQDADSDTGQRSMADRLGEKGQSLDHHQGAEAAEDGADHDAGEQGVDYEAIGQRFWQVARRGQALDRQAQLFEAHAQASSGWWVGAAGRVENSSSKRSGVRM